ncbi:MAG TPA: cytochrome c oxidase subunit II [Trichocoleus sp.]
MKQIPAPFWTLIIGVVVTLISIWAGLNHHMLPEQASAAAPLLDDFFNVMVMIGTALFLLVQGAIIFALIRFRRREGDDTDGLPIEGNLPLEALWTAIPSIVVISLGIYSVYVFQEMGGFAPGSHDHAHGALMAQAPQTVVTDVSMPMLAQAEQAVDSKIPVYGFGASPDEQGNLADLTVNVTGLQFAWVFKYPESGITDGELHIPVGRDVQLNITGQDVIHSFWIPQFRLKQDALPGQRSELRFVASKVGTYPIVCAELCGGYHGAMRTQVIVHSEEDFAQWVESRTASASTNDAIALNPAEQSDADYLATHTQDLGIDRHLISQLSQPLQ